MPENPRNRDLVILSRGRSITPTLSAPMAASGWKGGTGVQWVAPVRDEMTVGISDGEPAGFMLFGSDESADQFTSMTLNQPTYKAGAMAFGRWLVMTNTFERYTYTSRTGGGPLVEIPYKANDPLRFSLRGYWTKEDEWALSGDPRAPNGNIVGFVAQSPSVLTSYYMTVQTAF